MSKKDHLVNWKDVCRQKQFEGLSIGHLKERNLTLLGKWPWRFSNEKDSLWQSTILSKYDSHSNGWDANPSSS